MTATAYSQERIEPAKPAKPAREHVTCINSKILTWWCMLKLVTSIYGVYGGNTQAEGNVKLGFHTSASLTAVS